MKKVLIVSGVALLAFATIAGAATYNFGSNLTVGSTGADVIALQEALIAQGYSIPAIASGAAQKGYYGSQTKAAVAAYQVAKGIVNPGTGFFGPLTRGVINGTTVATTPAVVGCPVGYTCTANPGTPTTPTTPGTVTTVGAEGFITTKLASTPIADANIRTSSNVPVYGIEVKAQGSDMIVDRVLLQMSVGVGSATASLSNPATFVRKLYAYDGSTLIKSWELGAADFNKDSSDRYYVIASGMRFVVPKDTTKSLTFSVDVVGVSADQSSRYLTVQGYVGNTQNVRSVDGANMNSYTDMSGSANSRVQIFATSGSSSLTTTLNSGSTPKAQTNRLSTTDGVKGLTMQVFDIKSETGDSTIKSVGVASNATSSAGLPSVLYLYDGSTLVSSVSGAYTTTFTDLSIKIAKDTTKSLTIKADFPATANGQAASTTVSASGIKWEKPDSTTASTSPSSALVSNDQYLYYAAPQWTLVSSSMVAQAGVVGVSSSTILGTITLKATAFGGSMTKPTLDNFTLVFASTTQANGAYVTLTTAGNTQNAYTASTTNIQVTPSDATVGDGGTYTVTLTGQVASNQALPFTTANPSLNMFMAVKDIDSTVGGNIIANQTWGLDTFYTSSAVITKGTY
ncbi:MAG: peptidoglycan-binding domain-containing protein [Candidatus Paceibacterota bacterium]|jgi:hypothetical protein